MSLGWPPSPQGLATGVWRIWEERVDRGEPHCACRNSTLYVLVKEGWVLGDAGTAHPTPVCCGDPAEVAFGW